MKSQKTKSGRRREILLFIAKLSNKLQIQSKHKLQTIAVADNDWMWHYAY